MSVYYFDNDEGTVRTVFGLNKSSGGFYWKKIPITSDVARLKRLEPITGSNGLTLTAMLSKIDKSKVNITSMLIDFATESEPSEFEICLARSSGIDLMGKLHIVQRDLMLNFKYGVEVLKLK